MNIEVITMVGGKRRPELHNKRLYLAYGRENSYNSYSRKDLKKKDSSFMYAGERYGWLDELIPQKSRIQRPELRDKQLYIAYGREHGYYKMSRNKLRRKDDYYVSVGVRNGWIEELIPAKTGEDRRRPELWNREAYLAYGREHGYYKMTRNKLKTKDLTFLQRGATHGWISELIPSKRRQWKSKEEWLQFGREKGYDKLGRANLARQQPGYHQVGRKNGWIPELIPQKVSRRRPELWDKNLYIAYGCEHSYDKLSRKNLGEKDPTFLQRGQEKGWIGELIPSKRRQFKTKEEWLTYGREHGYDKLSRQDLKENDSGWLFAGYENNWINEILPPKKRSWKTKEQWLAHGREYGYDGMSRSQVEDLDSPYIEAGRKRGWLDELIPPKRPYVKKRQWKSKEEWLQFGREHGYDKLTRGKLDQKDHSYYSSGSRRKWLDDLIPPEVETPSQLINLLQKEENAKRAVGLAHGDAADLADVIAVLYEGRVSRADLQKMVEKPSVRDYIGGFQRPQTITEIVESGRALLPHDKNDMIRGLLKRQLIDYRRKKLGSNPTSEMYWSFMKEMKKAIGELDG